MSGFPLSVCAERLAGVGVGDHDAPQGHDNNKSTPERRWNAMCSGALPTERTRPTHEHCALPYPHATRGTSPAWGRCLMAVSKRTRYEVLKRDNHTCRYCHATDSPLTVDHVTPVALGGNDDPSNLVAACRDCNYGKASTSPDAPLVADVAQKAIEWGRAIELFNQQRSADRRKRDAYVRRFEKKWNTWWYGEDKKHFPKPSDWKASVWQFYSIGFPIVELEDAVDIACGHAFLELGREWRYMCGVVWHKVEQMHDGALALIDKEPANGS